MVGCGGGGGAVDAAHMVEYLSSMHKTLGSKLSALYKTGDGASL